MTTEKGRPEGLTPSQTVGPYFAYVLTPHAYPTRVVFTNDLAASGAPGRRIRVEGYVLDGDGEPIVDAMIEIWQADADGRYPSASDGRDRANAVFTGFGRTDVDSNGFFFFETVMPGRTPGPNGATQAPHLSLGVFARGVTKRLHTRLYFADQPGLDDDPVLAVVPAERRATLIAEPKRRGDAVAYLHTIRLQGEGETVFFES